MGIEFEGLDEFKDILKIIGKQFPVEKEKELKKLGLMAESQIKPLVNVDTGRLRNSLHSEIVDKNSVEVIAATEYASFVNNGHLTKSGKSFVKGSAFMERGFQNVEPMINVEIENWLNKLFKAGE